MPVNLLAVLNEPNAPLQATAAATLALLVKHIVTVFAQGGARFGAGMRPPEDVCFMPQAGTQSFDGTAKTAEKGNEDKGLKKAKEIEQRWTRIVANDLENIPLVRLFPLHRLLRLLSFYAHLVRPDPDDHTEKLIGMLSSVQTYIFSLLCLCLGLFPPSSPPFHPLSLNGPVHCSSPPSPLL